VRRSGVLIKTATAERHDVVEVPRLPRLHRVTAPGARLWQSLAPCLPTTAPRAWWARVTGCHGGSVILTCASVNRVKIV